MGDGATNRIRKWLYVATGKSSSPEQEKFIGYQTGGRVFLFLHTDNFERDYQNYISKGVEFTIAPHQEEYGMVAVFKDIYGNLWDLIEPSKK